MSDQLSCPLCAQSVAMTLIPHLRSDHKIEPEVFRTRFPEHPLCSERFAGFLAAHNVRKVNERLHSRLEVAGCPMTTRYGIEHLLIPPPATWPRPHCPADSFAVISHSSALLTASNSDPPARSRR